MLPMSAFQRTAEDGNGCCSGRSLQLGRRLPHLPISGNDSRNLMSQRPRDRINEKLKVTSGEVALELDLKDEQRYEGLSIQYTDTMQKTMGSPFVYRHEDGMNYSRILEDVIVGSCLQTANDVDWLVTKEAVNTIICLQEDKDLNYFGIDITAIEERCRERGDVKHMRCSITDFDPLSLRYRLPQVVAELAKIHDPTGGTVYVHCTAGLGRAPAVVIAYMYWCRGWQIQDAHNHLVQIRPCGPKMFAIRQATCDILYGHGEDRFVEIKFCPGKMPGKVQLSGLDIGWSSTVDLTFDEATGAFVTRRLLRPGKFHFKFIVDGTWICSKEYPIEKDGDHSNNYIEVCHNANEPHLLSAVERILSENGSMTLNEKWRIGASLKELMHAD